LLRPFIALRYASDRLTLTRAMTSPDPRAPSTFFGANDAARTYAWRDAIRAGVVVPDDVPSVTMWRAASGAWGLLVAWQRSVDVAAPLLPAPPVIARFDINERLTRILDNETDREPDASWTRADETTEVFVLTDDTTIARVLVQLESARVAAGDPALDLDMLEAPTLLALVPRGDEAASAPLGVAFFAHVSSR
jgi:hypothetical protein